MEVCRRSSWLLPLLGVILFAEVLQAVQDDVEIGGPSEFECRPYIEKALKELEHVAPEDATISNEEVSSTENIRIEDRSDNEFTSQFETKSQESQEKEAANTEDVGQPTDTEEKTDENFISEETKDTVDVTNEDQGDAEEETNESQENKTTEVSSENVSDEKTQPSEQTSQEAVASTETVSIETVESLVSAEEQTSDDLVSDITEETTQEEIDEQNLPTEPSQVSEETPESEKSDENETAEIEETKDEQSDEKSTESPVDSSVTEEDRTSDENIDKQQSEEDDKSNKESTEQEGDSKEQIEARSDRNKRSMEDSNADESLQNTEETDKQEVDTEGGSTESEQPSVEVLERESSEGERESEEADKTAEEEIVETKDAEINAAVSEETPEIQEESKEGDNETKEEVKESSEDEAKSEDADNSSKDEQNDTKSEEKETNESDEGENARNDTTNENSAETTENIEQSEETQVDTEDGHKSDANIETPEDDLTMLTDIPKDLRPRDHVEQLLKIDREATKTEEIIDRISEITLRDLKRLYENAIKPLETLYKYRDLSNRHYGDAEIFSKPLILFMGPWSGGKSSIINYLLNIEYNDTALQTGAEPSPAYFNLLMHGEEQEILDGTQLAADYTFSGLQKFGQGLEERLRGVKLPSKLLEKVNFVEIPGILEVRKQVSRVFPFNDACQWFIDRADIIFLVYDPSKLDVGPETEAILDQLKGREYQTRIVLNKADLVKPEELMRVQGALIWNISPLMSSPQPPIMYTTSLWSRPYEQWAPIRLLQAQERAFLRDLRTAIDRRIENKIASARRFAVRVRNHAKMVDCYLTTYYNHKSIFGNKKKVSDEIIEHPQDYHIYEGLSTLTNISRYDLPDPDVYKDFFRLNPLYEFQQLAATCTYFRGCPINKLDVAIAYDLPELVGKHKRQVEAALAESNQDEPQGS